MIPKESQAKLHRIRLAQYCLEGSKKQPDILAMITPAHYAKMRPFLVHHILMMLLDHPELEGYEWREHSDLNGPFPIHPIPRGVVKSFHGWNAEDR